MLKIMLFIDGTWLYSNTPKLAEAYEKDDFQVDFGQLPKVLAEEVSRQFGEMEMYVVRTYLFGSYAANYSDAVACLDVKIAIEVIDQQIGRSR